MNDTNPKRTVFRMVNYGTPQCFFDMVNCDEGRILIDNNVYDQ